MTAAPTVADVADALRTWVRLRLGDDVALTADPEPVTGGFDTYIYRFEPTTGGPMVLRLYPSATRGPSAARELAVLEFLAGVGYPAPRPIAASADTAEFGLPYVVMEQLPGRTVLDAVKSGPRRVHLLDSLAAAQASLHALDPAGWPHPPDPAGPASEIDRRLAAAPDPLPAGIDPGLLRALHWLQGHAAVARHEEPVICHNDFHPVNAIADEDGRLRIIDWENAAIGDRHSDLARSLVLFEWAPVVASKTVERVALRALKPWITKRYRAAYARHLPVDEARLHYWMAFHAADSWWEASTLLSGTFGRDTRTDARQGPAAVVAPAMARLFGRLVPDA